MKRAEDVRNWLQHQIMKADRQAISTTEVEFNSARRITADTRGARESYLFHILGKSTWNT